jgi:hypothetical protein
MKNLTTRQQHFLAHLLTSSNPVKFYQVATRLLLMVAGYFA